MSSLYPKPSAHRQSEDVHTEEHHCSPLLADLSEHWIEGEVMTGGKKEFCRSWWLVALGGGGGVRLTEETERS